MFQPQYQDAYKQHNQQNWAPQSQSNQGYRQHYEQNSYQNEHSSQPNPNQAYSSSSFYFRPRRERINWRFLASIQLERVIRDVDIQILQEIMENITFCDLEAEDLRHVDPNIVKLFQLSQLIIEYQLHSQEYLVSQKSGVDQENAEAIKKSMNLMNENTALKTELADSKKEMKTLKKTLNVYQLMAKLPAGGGHGAPATLQSYNVSRHLLMVSDATTVQNYSAPMNI
jgi:predicted RNase H-like nuclease (RuvC/YqgF family)